MSVFALKPTDMPGVPQKLIEHSFKQNLWRLSRDKKEVIRVKVIRLLATSFIKEVYHPEWLANPVFIRKKNKEWRMYVDYTVSTNTALRTPSACLI
jgi:hypothetical protein